jgi:hypothetical protein
MNLLKLQLETRSDSHEKSRSKRKQPPRIMVREIDEPLPYLNLEVLERLIGNGALRKLKELEERKKH